MDNKFAIRINNLCAEKHLSKYRVAKNGKINYSTMNHIMNYNHPNPKHYNIEKICQGLGISVREFYNDKIFESR